MRKVLLLGFIPVFVLGVLLGVYLSSSLSYASPATSETQLSPYGTTHTEVTASSKCVVPFQPAGFYLRILSNSSLKPVVGALVSASNIPVFCNNVMSNNKTTVTFTTTGSSWYELAAYNNGGYSIGVNYSGKNYTFTAGMAPTSVTCATFYLPSGLKNITISSSQAAC